MNNACSIIAMARNFISNNEYKKALSCYRLFRAINIDISDLVRFNETFLQGKIKESGEDCQLIMEVPVFENMDYTLECFWKIIQNSPFDVKIDIIQGTAEKSYLLAWFAVEDFKKRSSLVATDTSFGMKYFLEKTGFFDTQFYEGKYKSTLNGEDALEHFVRHGFGEGKLPAQWYRLYMDSGENHYGASSEGELTWKNAQQPLLSVVIPVFNSEKFLENCLDSVLSQYVKNIEVICIDDGSTDSSYEILNKYRTMDNRIVVKRQSNKHAGIARNVGLYLSKGKFVHFLDSDDWVEKNIYLKTLEVADGYDADVVVFNYNRVDSIDGTYQKNLYFDVEKGSIYNKVFFMEEYKNMFLRGPVVPWNKIYKKSFLFKERLEFDSLVVANDRSFYFKLVKANPKTFTIRDALINYRTNNDQSLVGNKRSQNFNCHFYSFDSIKDIFWDDPGYQVILDQFLTDLRFFYEKTDDNARDKIKNTIFKYLIKNKAYFSNIEEMKGKKSYYFYHLMVGGSVIPLVFSVDNNYIKYLSVAIISLIKNTSKIFKLNIVVLYTDLTEENKSILKKLETDSVVITFYNVTYLTEKYELYSRAHYSISMYYRLLIPQIFYMYDKVIYLDCDLLVIDDISELFFTDLGDYYLAAATNFINKEMRRYVNYKLDIDYPNYFNSGVIIFNNKKWNEYKLHERCFDIVENTKDLVCPDQDVLNIVCRDKVKYIDSKWNFAWQHIVLNSELSHEQRYEIDRIKNNISIIHYTSGVKPWRLSFWKNELGKIWWKYAAESPYYEILISDLSEFKKKNKFILSENA